MNPGRVGRKIIDRKVYDTATATLISGDDYWDGHNYERGGTNCFLWKTPKGAFFAEYLTQWQGSRDSLEPLSEGEAIKLYECHQQKGHCRLDFEEAFPGVEIEEA